MKKVESKPLDPINAALTTWDKNKDVAEFIKERMGLKEEGKNETHAEELIDNVIKRAKTEDKPEWTSLLLNQIKEEKVKAVGPQINVFANAAAVTDDTLKKLIDVTPAKKETKIEELI